MKNIKEILKYVVLLYLMTVGNLYAKELRVRTINTTRYYLSVEATKNGAKLKHFSQSKGEYQSLISSHEFKNKSELEKYVSIYYSNYLPVKKLDFWQVIHAHDKYQDKLFGRGEKKQAIWYAKNKWDAEWEFKYGQWLQNEVTPDFYKRLNIATDCADAVVGLRWIFARINSLPVANTISDTENLFGHFSMKKEWRRYDTASNWYDDELFMAALDYVMNLTSTRTIIKDGFPVVINREGLVPGTYIVTQSNGAGHAKVISETHYEEITELPLYTLLQLLPERFVFLLVMLQVERNRPIHVTENEGYTLFRKTLAGSQIIFRIQNDKIEFIKEYSGITNQAVALLTVTLNKNTMSFIDLDCELNVDITLENPPVNFDMKNVKISSYNYPQAVLIYADQNEDKSTSVIVNLYKKSWIKMAPSIKEKYLVLWSSSQLNKVLVQTKYNQEFPILYAVEWDKFNNFTIHEMGNLYFWAKIINGTAYFISASGGAWELNPDTSLYLWDKTPVEVNVVGNYEVKFLTSLGAYFTSDEGGLISVLGITKNLNLPKGLLADDEFCQIQSKVEEIFSYRFNSSYGDYSYMGGSLLKSDLTEQNAEGTPQFSIYSWINKKSLLDLNWQKLSRSLMFEAEQS